MDDIPDLVANRYSEGEIQAFLWFLFGCFILVLVAYIIAAWIRASSNSPFEFLVRPIKKTRLRRISEDELKRPFHASHSRSIRSRIGDFIKQIWAARRMQRKRPQRRNRSSGAGTPRCINQSYPDGDSEVRRG